MAQERCLTAIIRACHHNQRRRAKIFQRIFAVQYRYLSAADNRLNGNLTEVGKDKEVTKTETSKSLVVKRRTGVRDRLCIMLINSKKMPLSHWILYKACPSSRVAGDVYLTIPAEAV